MKSKPFLLVLALVLGLATLVARAGLPTFQNKTASGNSTAGATVYFAHDPNSQIRIVYVNYSNDKASGSLSLFTGTTAFSEQSTNAATSSVTNLLNATNGLAPSQTLILEHNGAPYTASVSSWGTYITGTNTFGFVTNQAFVVTGAGGFAVQPNVGDNVYVESAGPVIPVGAATNVISGDAVYVGNYGRPVLVSLSAATTANNLYSVSAHYDSASQPGN